MKNQELLEQSRSAMVDRRVKELLAGSPIDADNYDPYSKKNFEEFLQNMPEDTVIRLMECCKRGMVGSAGAILKGGARVYWKEIAKDRAEKETPSIEELYQYAANDAARARRAR